MGHWAVESSETLSAKHSFGWCRLAGASGRDLRRDIAGYIVVKRRYNRQYPVAGNSSRHARTDQNSLIAGVNGCAGFLYNPEEISDEKLSDGDFINK